MTEQQGFLSKEEEKKWKEKRDAKLAQEITEDFNRRREERRSVENGWLLNMQFLSGNQYCDVSPFGGLEAENKQFYWQTRRVFNHIAPTVDSRLAKLEKMRPVLTVRAFSDEDGDLKAAKLATGVLKYVQDRIGFGEIVSKATAWAETCGSVFYKVLWDENAGRKVAVDENGQGIFEGEVRVCVVPPFEIYPDKLYAEGLDEVESLIHARIVPLSYVFEKFGVEVDGAPRETLGVNYGQTVAENRFFGGSEAPTNQENAVLLIERYSVPSGEYPNGKLEIVAGGKLLFEGELPYQNGERRERALPFVKQDCLHLSGSFFGVSVIDRLIPVQRAYNAVRNRKHEFLNRVSMGVLTVEDGSVDTDELSEEGLLPGKVLVYRQGGKAPEMLDCGNVPAEFAAEEEWLEKEFSLISGVSDLSQSSTPARVTSATGLQLLLAQDESRLSVTMGSIQRAMKEIGKQILRLYRQFAGSARLMTLTGENKKTQVYYFNAGDLAVNDVQFQAQDASTPEEKQAVLLRLYEAGVLTDGDGKLTTESKNRILEAFGFGSFENARDISALHIAKAGEENLLMKERDVDCDSYDDHALHITEHTRFLLSAEFKKSSNSKDLKGRYTAHLNEHKNALKEENAENNDKK